MSCPRCNHFSPEMFNSGNCTHPKVMINAYEPVVPMRGVPVWCPLLEKPEVLTKENYQKVK